jgi:hypothetical protein
LRAAAAAQRAAALELGVLAVLVVVVRAAISASTVKA